MDARENFGEVPAFGQRERQARGVQHVGTEITVDRQQDADRDGSGSPGAQDATGGIRDGALCRGRVGKGSGDYDLHEGIDYGDGGDTDHEGYRDVAAWITHFAGGEEDGFEATVGVHEDQDGLEPVFGFDRGRQRGWGPGP